MKTIPHSQNRYRRATVTALLALVALPATLQARHENDYRYGDRYVRSHYYSHPRTSFTLSFGTGYAGRGYYYGPPGAAYYYERPGVAFYRDRSLVPRHYWNRGYDRGHRTGGSGYDVQRALARHGYYRGPVDGVVGPGTRRAIAAFEARNGLPVRGTINHDLLVTLGLR